MLIYDDPVINQHKIFFFPVAETPCVKFYHTEREGGELLRLCRGDECTCAEGKSDERTCLNIHLLTLKLLKENSMKNKTHKYTSRKKKLIFK